MSTSLSISGDQESRLRQFLRVMGLPENSVRFMRSENVDDVPSSIDSRDRRPLVIELASVTGVPPPRACLDIPQRDANHCDIFLFGLGAFGHYQNQEPCPQRDTPKAGRGNIPLSSEIRFSNDALWGPLQGLRANWPVSPEFSPMAWVRSSGSWHPLITIGEEPWFLRSCDNGTTRFLWASRSLPDISEPLKLPDEGQQHRLLRLLPLLVFFRHAFGKKTWHVPVYFANLIVDDPPVRDRYGFFEPARHLALLADIPHATTVGFIPWNWNRSTRRAAEVFLSHGSQLSLCMHGCDHTGGEFASFNRTTLSGKCQLALLRAELFRKRTGLSCAPVMVFPQGLFSKAAIAALRETNFLASVNSTLCPIDSVANEVRFADLLEPAFAGIEDFPIFLRRYPRDPVLCAVDLFLGRPLLVVEHQEYFGDGYAECRRFLEAINGFQCRLSWAPLDQIVRRACLQREIEPGRLEVRFYADTFIVENRTDEILSYHLVRRWSRPDLIRGVAVNGSFVDHTFEQGQVAFTLDLWPGRSATIQFTQDRLPTNEVFRGSLFYRARVWIRRSLCDLRDNHVWMSQFAHWIKYVFRRGGFSD